MKDWSLSDVLSSLHNLVEQRLGITNSVLAHSTTKGDASENAWLELFEKYLPARYRVCRAHVVDSEGQFSDQLDLVVYDRQYSPIIFTHEGQTIVPAESVYAVFEAKQAINSAQIKYASDKVQSVRELKRTSLPIPHAGGKFDAKEPHHILGGVVAFQSDWNPPLGNPLKHALESLPKIARLELGCVAKHGVFFSRDEGAEVRPSSKAATAFVLELIAHLQEAATVPMIDVRAYARWLSE